MCDDLPKLLSQAFLLPLPSGHLDVVFTYIQTMTDDEFGRFASSASSILREGDDICLCSSLSFGIS